MGKVRLGIKLDCSITWQSVIRINCLSVTITAFIKETAFEFLSHSAVGGIMESHLKVCIYPFFSVLLLSLGFVIRSRRRVSR